MNGLASRLAFVFFALLVTLGPASAVGAQVVAVQSSPAAAPVPAAPIDDDPIRFRFGVEVNGALFVSQSTFGAGAGLAFRFGAQFNQWFAIYYQPHGFAGAFIGGDDEVGSELGVIGGVFNAAMLELTLPFVQLGAGPSLDAFVIANCNVEQCGSGGTPVYFGLDGRLALVLGAIGRGARGGFSINAHVHPTFVGGDVMLTATLGVGGELY